jgi:hypothetical protein
MKKIFTLFLVLPIILSAQENSRIGVSLGFGTSDYDFIEIDSENETIEVDSSHSTQYLGVDYGFGNHTFAVTTAVADLEEVNEAGSYYNDSYYPIRSAEIEFDDFNLTYTYRLNSSWQVGIGYNKLTQDYHKNYIKNIDFEGIGLDANNQYTWTYTDLEEATSDGLTIFAGYVQPMSNNLFATARVGFTQQDYSTEAVWTEITSGFSPEFDSCLSGNGCPSGFAYNGPQTAGLNGYGYEGNASLKGDATAAVFGVGVVWVLNQQNTVSFDFAVRSFDYGELTLSESSSATGYFSGGDTQVPTVDSSPVQSELEEDYSFFSVKWRYKLN